MVQPWEQYPVIYTTQREWMKDHQHTLVLCCSEPRMPGLLEEFLQTQLRLERYTRILKGGGSLTVTLDYSYFFATRWEIEELHARHAFSNAVLIAHHGCGMYQIKYPSMKEEERFVVQRKHLYQAREYAAAFLPKGAGIALYYAQPLEGHLTFRAIK